MAEPLVITIELKVYDHINNLSLATAIYNWYEEYLNGYNYGDINLYIVAELLHTQMLEREIVERRREEGCEYDK